MKLRMEAVVDAILEMAKEGQIDRFRGECEENRSFITANSDLVGKAKLHLHRSRLSSGKAAVVSTSSVSGGECDECEYQE